MTYLNDGASIREQPPGDSRRRLPILLAVAVVAIALVGTAAFVAARFWLSSNADPAERLPESAIFYADINLLDVNADEDAAAMVRRLLNQFGLEDSSADLETDVSDLLAALGVEGIDPADVTRWIGARAAIAVYNDTDSAVDDVIVAVALASRNDGAARENLAAIQVASTETFGYVVDDGLAVLAFADRDPQARLEAIVAAGPAAPIAELEPFRSGLEELGGDYFATAWIDIPDESALGFDDIAEDNIPLNADHMLPKGAELLDISTVTGTNPIVMGLQAIDGGLEAHFVAGASDGLAGRSDWLDTIGELASAQVAMTVTLPADLGEPSDKLIQFIDDIYNGPLPNLDEHERGKWDYDLALSNDELEEYKELERRAATGELTQDDPDFERLVELDDTYWTFGLQEDYDQAAESGWLESYFSTRALNHDEYYGLLQIELEWDTPAVTDVDREWYYKAIRRLYAYGVHSDYAWYEPDVDAEDVAGQFFDYLSGISITAAADDIFGKLDLGLAAEVAEGQAVRLHRLPRQLLHDLFEVLEAEPRFDDSRVVFKELDTSDGTLSDHPRFADAFDDMPTEAALALFIDVQEINASAPRPGNGVDAIDVVSLVYGTSGNGVLRVLANDEPATDEPATDVNAGLG